MAKYRWYKRDPEAALTGMAVLNLEERGAYNTVLDLIYVHQGNLKDDDRLIAGWLHCDVRRWRRIRRRLIDLEKLYLSDGLLRNRRCDAELDALQHRHLSATIAGQSSWRSRQEKLSIYNKTWGTVVERPFNAPSYLRKKDKEG